MRAQFSTLTPEVYLTFVDSLQYVFYRNYTSGAILKRLSLQQFPTAMHATQDYLVVGTKKGGVMVFAFRDGSKVQENWNTHKTEVRAVQISRAGNYFMSADSKMLTKINL